MGVLQRFERRLEGLVEGAFARAFKDHVQPVEVAAALQREAGNNKAVVAAGRVLVPNNYVVELGREDLDRLSPYDEALCAELADMVSEHAGEQGWSFVGPVGVRLEHMDDLKTGVFRVRSAVTAGSTPPADAAADSPSGPRLVYSDSAGERVVPLEGNIVIGRGPESDLQLPDTGVSRRHAEVRRTGAQVQLVDLDSTNGTEVNGRAITQARLHDGDQIQIGTVHLTYREGD
ncbi:MAG TPA: DUF3662 and FHA domain-containing protein [Mycobacteriales bacterium]|nr:DUF3662 and FHA domain-containing protein [Mycobacteriales bacterium]